LDAIDLRILQLLATNARVTYHAIAAALNIAESTAHARLSALTERGVVKGTTPKSTSLPSGGRSRRSFRSVCRIGHATNSSTRPPG
jgi:DNA-binding Lrp family transcriptional regulator